MNKSTNKSMIFGASSQSAAMSASAGIPAIPHSPINEMLQAIEKELSNAHEEFSMLDNKVEPIRAAAPEGATGECSPREVMPTQMENQLRNIYDTVRYLTGRIERTRAELRI